MLTQVKVRGYVLAVHGALALSLGLALLYLRATMTNLLFEVVATAVAITLSIAALMMAALTDWIAAFAARQKHIHKAVFYVLAGAFFAAIGFYAVWYPEVSMQLLLILAAVHAAVAGIWSIFFILEHNHTLAGKIAVFVVGLISFFFASTLALSQHASNSDAIALLGAYTIFIGLKMLFFAWRLRKMSVLPRGSANAGIAPA